MSKARQLADLGNVYDDGALSHRNLIINGAMQVAQRGTSFSGNVYTLDRFKAGNNPTDVSQNTSDVPSGFQYSMNLTGANHLINYRMESKDSFRLNGETVTLSFYAKNISGTNTLKVQLGHPSATDNFAIQTALETSSSITLTSSWSRYEVTFSSLSSQIEKGLFFYIYREGSTSTDQTRITGIQLEVGDTATPFEHRSYGDELQRCSRYAHVLKPEQAYGRYRASYSDTGTSCNTFYEFPVEMRSVPTLTSNNMSSSTFQCYSETDGGFRNPTGAFTLGESSKRHVWMSCSTATASSGAVGMWRWNNNPSASMFFDAEL